MANRRTPHAVSRCRLSRVVATCLATSVAALCAVGADSEGSPLAHVRAAAAQRPNIVFVLTDDLSSNLLRYMPHVQQLAQQGETFSNYFVTDSLCCPSRSSILTGKLPHDTGVYSNTGPNGGFNAFYSRGEESDTFATRLQAAGYHTAMMGKYLNGYKPGATLGGAGPYVPPGWDEWDVAGDGYPEFGYSLNENGSVVPHGYAASDYLTDVLAQRGTSFVDRSAASGQPFMLELATFAPHSPYTPPPRYAHSFRGLRAPRTPAFDAQNANAPAWLRGFPALTRSQTHMIDHDFRQRVRSVQAVDDMVGQIESELAADGVAQNTYFVFSSDNGLHMGEHRLRPGKLTAFDTDIRVPLIVAGPGVPAGATADQMTENIDLAPTFEELGGATAPAGVDGHSLVPLLQGSAPGGWRNAVLIEHRHPDPSTQDPDLALPHSGNPTSYEAIRTPNALYVEYADGEREYYDLASDPFELYNTVSLLSPGRLAALHATLTAIANCHDGAGCWGAEHGSAMLNSAARSHVGLRFLNGRKHRPRARRPHHRR